MGSSEADKAAKESKTPATQVDLYLMFSLLLLPSVWLMRKSSESEITIIEENR